MLSNLIQGQCGVAVVSLDPLTPKLYSLGHAVMQTGHPMFWAWKFHVNHTFFILSVEMTLPYVYMDFIYSLILEFIMLWFIALIWWCLMSLMWCELSEGWGHPDFFL